MGVLISKELQEKVLRDLNMVDIKVFLLVVNEVMEHEKFNLGRSINLSKSYIIENLDLQDRFVNRFRTSISSRLTSLSPSFNECGISLNDTEVRTGGVEFAYVLNREMYDKFYTSCNNGYYVMDLDILGKFGNRDTNTFKLYVLLMRLSNLKFFKQNFKDEFLKVCNCGTKNFTKVFKLGVTELRVKGLIHECTYVDGVLNIVVEKPKEEEKEQVIEETEKEKMQEDNNQLAKSDMEKFNITYNKLFGRTVTKKEFNEFVSNYNSCQFIKDYSLDGLIKFLEDYVELGYYDKDYGCLKSTIFTNSKQGIIVENVVNGVKKWVDKKTPQKSCSEYNYNPDDSFTLEESDYYKEVGYDEKKFLEKYGHRFDTSDNENWRRISFD